MTRFLPRRLLALASLLLPLLAAAEPVADYRLKAAIIYNFAVFTTWPASTLAAAEDFKLCFMQAPELRQGMQELNIGSLHGKRLAMHAAPTADLMRRCQVLVLGAMAPERRLAIQRALAGLPVLTVSDDVQAQEEVMIAMAAEKNRIVFDIDQGSMRAARLEPSSKLLRLARSVR